MGITANHILSDIRNIATSGSNPQDYRIEDSQILFWIDEIGSMLKSQDIQKRKDISDIWLQVLNCLELEQVDISECCSTETGCKVLRTVLEIPSTIEINGDNTIIRVEDGLGNIISKSTPFESKYIKNGKYSSSKPRWIHKNRRIYILENDFLDNINIVLIPEKPSDLAAYTSCNGNPCYSPTDNYPCSMKMASDITNIILKTKVYPFIQLPQDTTNDASDRFNTEPNTRNI